MRARAATRWRRAARRTATSRRSRTITASACSSSLNSVQFPLPSHCRHRLAMTALRSPAMRRFALLVLLAACGDDGPAKCDAPGPFPAGDLDGHPQPLAAGPNEARAGRAHAADLPAVSSGLITWQDGDFVLANDRIAL